MSIKLTVDELARLQSAFDHLTNYESDDPTDPVDPLTYRSPDGDSCLHVAVILENLELVQLLIKGGVDVNLVGDMGCTALHVATRRKNQEIIDLLLENGASTDVLDEFGKLPLEK